MKKKRHTEIEANKNEIKQGYKTKRTQNVIKTKYCKQKQNIDFYFFSKRQKNDLFRYWQFCSSFRELKITVYSGTEIILKKKSKNFD